jgi:hypothetical protein
VIPSPLPAVRLSEADALYLLDGSNLYGIQLAGRALNGIGSVGALGVEHHLPWSTEPTVSATDVGGHGFGQTRSANSASRLAWGRSQ